MKKCLGGTYKLCMVYIYLRWTIYCAFEKNINIWIMYVYKLDQILFDSIQHRYLIKASTYSTSFQIIVYTKRNMKITATFAYVKTFILLPITQIPFDCYQLGICGFSAKWNRRRRRRERERSPLSPLLLFLPLLQKFKNSPVFQLFLLWR